MKGGWLPGRVRYFVGKTAAPGVSDDLNSGYRVSDIWVDETADKFYICVDASAGAASWSEGGGAGGGDFDPAEPGNIGKTTPAEGCFTKVGIGTVSPVKALDILSSVSGKPAVKLENTNADDLGSELEFYKNSTSPANYDIIGEIKHSAKNSVGTKVDFSFMRGYLVKIDSTHEAGGWMFTAKLDGANLKFLDMRGNYGVDGTGVVYINSNQADIDFLVFGDDVATPVLTVDASRLNVSINIAGVSANYDLLLGGDGVLALKETTTPTADANYGKVYTKNDNKLYFQDGAGVEHELAFA